MESSRRIERLGGVRDAGRGNNRENLENTVMSLDFIIRIIGNQPLGGFKQGSDVTGFSFLKNPWWLGGEDYRKASVKARKPV